QGAEARRLDRLRLLDLLRCLRGRHQPGRAQEAALGAGLRRRGVGVGVAGDHPFIMQADGRSWLYVPQGLEDGPLPTHYEPHESPFDNPLYSQRSNPRRQQNEDLAEDPYNPVADEPGAEVYPYVVTTYRLTEHHTAGGMTRSVPYLAELQPQMFCEVHPDLARDVGLEHGGWATIYTSRSAIEARVMVTDRMRPVRMDGREVHQIGLP